jgi:MoxR-like ATPase
VGAALRPHELQRLLREQGYLADRGLGSALYLSLSLRKPLLLEGEAGVGKTEAARALAAALSARLIRLQCYEGLDQNQALYEWNYAKQLLHIRALSSGDARRVTTDELFGPEFLVERPLLAAIRSGRQAILLIDEVDRADDEFEAFLLELLSDFAVTIPEIGTIEAESPPVVVVTSNRTRDLHDALKRRCIYHWIDYPTLEREAEIVRLRAPALPEQLTGHVAAAVAHVRALGVAKPPGIAETIDWAEALHAFGAERLEPELALDTLGSLLKERDDLERARAAVHEILS